jgi:outer membrane receptor protein involved in Fe transport
MFNYIREFAMGKTKDKVHRLGLAYYIAVSLLSLLIISFDAFGADASDSNLFSMSLEQLMDVGVYAPATLTEKDPLKTPASVTVITSRDIALTPARNILDLIEIYVPGAIYLNHSIGPTLGIRGIIGDRSYKYLINVNGVNINNKAHYGARMELLNWELNDIDRIEIIRGPGSVTYGPGAIGGVINIYTKRAKQAPGLQIGGSYWGKYDSVGNYVSYGRVRDDYDFYSYFSLVYTKGTPGDIFATDSSKRFGYLGKNGGPESPKPPISYMGDYYGEPQVKAHIDVHFHDTWRFWARYTTESTAVVQSTATQFLIDHKYQDFRMSRFRDVMFVLENQSALSKDWDLKSTFALTSIDVHDIQKWDGTAAKKVAINNDKDNMQNIGWIYSEWKYYAQFMLNYKPEDKKIKGALGFEISYDTIRPAWGKNRRNGLRLSDGIMSGPDSWAYGNGKVAPGSRGNRLYNSSDPQYYGVGQGWETISYAPIGELNIELTPKTTMIVSARIDKHSYTNYMLSPRLAFIHELNKDEYLKFIIQRSVRINTQEELYMNHIRKNENFPEKLDTMELIYTKKLNDRWTIETSVFYDKNNVIAWDSVQRKSAPLGTLELFGVEAEAKYKKDNFEFGINHSLAKQLNWTLAQNISTSGISASDYFAVATDNAKVVLHGNGNDLNNWANQATKLWTNIDLLENRMTLHGDLRALWGFEGARQALDELAQAGGDAAAIDGTRDRGAFGVQLTGDLSLTYRITKNADFQVFLQNIPVYGDNKRYSYNSGYKKSIPDKASWVEEPMVIGFKYNLRF